VFLELHGASVWFCMVHNSLHGRSAAVAAAVVVVVVVVVVLVVAVAAGALVLVYSIQRDCKTEVVSPTDSGLFLRNLCRSVARMSGLSLGSIKECPQSSRCLFYNDFPWMFH